MAHGYRDYGVGQSLSDVFSLLDQAELAARLGSASIFDRSGRVLFADDFSSGLGSWYTSTSAVGDKLELAPGSGRSGGYSLLCTVASDPYSDCHAERRIAYPQSTRFGCEVSFARVGPGLVITLSLGVTGLLGGGECGVMYDVDSGSLSVYDALGVRYVYPDAVLVPSDSSCWSSLKFTVDRVSGSWGRLRFNHVSASLSSLSLAWPAVGDEYYIALVLHALNPSGYGGLVWFDDAILTVDEQV